MKTWCLLIWFFIFQAAEKGNYYSGTDYKAVFGNDWEKAESLLAKNSEVFAQMSEMYKVPYNEVTAVVFPELIRYSAIQDKIELTLLKILYVYKGARYGDFSIGILQMKPSFAEMIWGNTSVLDDKSVLGDPDFNIIQTDTIAWRKQIISDLEDPIRQFRYLLAFYKICEQNFGCLAEVDNTDRVRFLSCAYNAGFNHSEELIRSMEGKEFFTITTLKTGPFYAYADIAEFYFNLQN